MQMTIKWVFLIAITSILCTTCQSQNECTSAIVGTSQIIITCPSAIAYQELPLYNYTVSQLANITSIIVNGPNDNSSGPFTSIPPNICLLPNIASIDFSYNRIVQVDPAGALSECFSNVTYLDMSYNNISEFPSAMIYNMVNLENLYFQQNLLTDVPGNAFYNLSNVKYIDFSYNLLTTFELWVLLVEGIADFSHNQISTITNKRFFDLPLTTSQDYSRGFHLNNNNPSINLTDAIYEMYNSCSEVIDLLDLDGSMNDNIVAFLSYNLAFVDFGTTRIACSCDQSYIIQMLINTFGSVPASGIIPIANANCTDNTRFVDFVCPSGTDPPNSSVDFSKVYPRQCTIYTTESGNLTITPNITVPTVNVSTYPHYETELMNPGACFFSFSNATQVRIKCTNDLSSISTIPSLLLSSPYFSSITHIDFTKSISSLPSYLCSLPSHEIDLSFQSFTTLTNATFPCLDWFRTIHLSYNQLTSVNMTSGNFTNLILLDLSSNRLTTIPYSILNPTPTSLRYLDLRNNSITSIDAFLYTLKNITVDLRDNPIMNLTIINPQNITFPAGNNTNLTVIITLPSSVSNNTYIFNDQTALTAGTCDRNAILAYRNELRTLFSDVLLDCTCASINLKTIFLRTGYNITDDFICTNGTTVANFSTLTMSSCASSALNFSSGLCYNESLQWTTTTTTTTTSTSTSTTSTTSTTSVTTTTSSTSTTSATTTTSSTSTTSVTTTTSSTSTTSATTTTSSTSTTSATTTTSSTSTTSVTTTTSSTSTTSVTTSTTTTIVNTTGQGFVSSAKDDSNANRTGLIIGLVLGIIAFLAIIGALIAAIMIAKAKTASSSAAANKPVGRATAMSQAPQNALLQSRVQTRNLRSVRLAPLNTQPSSVPPSYMGSTATNPSTAIFNRPDLHTTPRGIPLPNMGTDMRY